MKACIYPLNPGQITDRQTASSRFSPKDGACSDTTDVISSDSISVGSIVAHAGSVDKDTSSNASEPISTGRTSLNHAYIFPFLV